MKTRKAVILLASLILATVFYLPLQAKTVKANKWYSGDLEKGDKITWTMKMPATGYLFFEGFENGKMKITKGSSWATAEWEGYTGYFHDEVAKKDSSVKVVMKGRSKSAYKIRIRVIKKAAYEKESNNSKGKANGIKAGVMKTGKLKSDEADWFVFKVPASKKYKLVVRPLSESGDEKLKYAAAVNGKKLGSGTAKKKTVIFTASLKKGQKVYIKLSNPYAAYSFYDLKMSK